MRTLQAGRLAMEKTLVIGLGNPILGDDGVGWKVAELVQTRLDGGTISPILPAGSEPIHICNVEVDFASVGGLRLMESMLGYQRAILVDAIRTGNDPIGTVRVFPIEELTNIQEGHTASAHDSTLPTALAAARLMGLTVPESVMVVAIEAENTNIFSEELSPNVADAVPSASDAIFQMLRMEEA